MLVGVGVRGGAATATAAAPAPAAAAAAALLRAWRGRGQAVLSRERDSGGPRGPPGRGGASGALPGLQMGACSTVVVDVRMDFSRSRSLSDEDVAVGLVRWVGPPGRREACDSAPGPRKGLDLSSGAGRRHPATPAVARALAQGGLEVLPGDSGELLSRPLKCWGAVGR